MGISMSRRGAESYGSQIAPGMDVPRPQLAASLATALRSATVAEHLVATAATTLQADVTLCDQLDRLPARWRAALRRAESEATEQLGVGLSPGAAHLIDLGPAAIVVVHGDGWSLVGRTPAMLVFLLDVAPGVVIDLSHAEGAAELVGGLVNHASAALASPPPPRPART